MMRLSRNIKFGSIYLCMNNRLCTSSNGFPKGSKFGPCKHFVNIKEKMIPAINSCKIITKEKIIGCPQNVKLYDYFFKLHNNHFYVPVYARNIGHRISLLLLLGFAFVVITDDKKWGLPEIILGVALSPPSGALIGLLYPIIIPSALAVFTLYWINNKKHQLKNDHYRH